MYTQCPDCATVFRVTAEALRAAQGDVRCGVCSTTFNALENLSEKAFKPALEAEPPAPDDSMTVEELPGGENIELSVPVDLSVVPEDPASSSEAEDEARALEFHGDAADLDRLFVVEDATLATFDPGEIAKELSGPHPKPDLPLAAVDLDSTDEHPILVLEERDELPEEAGESIVLETLNPEPEPAPPPPAIPERRATAPERRTTSSHAAHAPPGHTAPRILIPDEMRKRLAEEAASRGEDSSRIFEPDDDEPGFLAQRWPWVAGAASLALLFLLQVIHAARNDLVRSPTFGPTIAGAYAVLGLSVLAPTDLAAYELHQWGAASDPNEANRLMLRASIVNRASYAQPLPLLRLTLQDLYGGTLGLRDIGPADYLPGPGGTGLLEPGQRADALIRIVDPGTAAVGFELDICLPARGGVRCASQIKTARQ